ncbi:glycosyl transferase family 2 [Cyanobacterium stanieri PCC 7202]|uniref:Glycosyl transferase family 2 n=1 Tax=Cyanobacterium stanieri (strain ATCC 29140 / PCC 7202) TaxID=292563 RepID=K9YNL9_CYASC|nr:glycosyl transferase family 2 [Cyanobacterium stanieri PCC 7202]
MNQNNIATKLTLKYSTDNNCAVWLSKQGGVKNFAYSDGSEQEKYLETCLKQVNDLSSTSPQLATLIRDWSSEYHLTAKRSNLLRPLLLDKFDTVLELGAGCGAITRYLGENLKEVLAIEGSFNRAKIASLRCRDLENVNVVCSNFQDIEIDHKFDLVTLIGVLEYSGKYIDNENPYLESLKMAKSHLKEDGCLIIAIDNKLGLKYFLGCSEDHTGIHFDGLEGYSSGSLFRTFGKKELEILLKNAGFESTEFLFPFPDYKIPDSILIERNYLKYQDSQEKKEPFIYQWLGGNNSRDYSNRKIDYNVQELLVMKELEANGLLADMSNSFLVIASNNKNSIDKLIPSDLVVEKYNTTNRKLKYMNKVSLKLADDQLYVRRDLIHPDLLSEDTRIQHICNYDEEFTKGTNLIEYIIRALKSNSPDKIDQFKHCLQIWYNFLLQNTNENPEENSIENLTLSGDFIDCVPWNLIVTQSYEVKYIDKEWASLHDIEVKYVLFRGFYHLFLRYKELIKLVFENKLKPFHQLSFLLFCYQILSAPITRKELENYFEQDNILGRFLTTETINKKVSICIPTCNGEAFLAEALESLEKQTYDNIEVIISDDNSIDNTIAIARTYAEKSRFQYHIFEHERLGIVNNWNYCIQKAQGKYIKFLFQDDLIETTCVEKMVYLAEQDQEIGLVFSPRFLRSNLETKDNEQLQTIINYCTDVYSYWSQLNNIQWGLELINDPKLLQHPINKIGEPTTVLIRKEVFEKVGYFDSDFSQLIDLEMWLRIMGHYKIGFIPEYLSTFRIHPKQTSSSNSQSGESNIDFYRLYAKMSESSEYNFLPSHLRQTINQTLQHWNYSQPKLQQGFSKSKVKSLIVSPIESLPHDLKRPFWSVIIPTYNPDLEDLKRNLHSVLEQNISADMMEIYVVDDCSENGEAIKNLVKEVSDHRIKYYRNSQNLGLVENWNNCINLATGHWIHILHQDDYILKGFYDKLQMPLENNPEIGAAFCRHIYEQKENGKQTISDLERETAGILDNWLQMIAIRQRIQCASIVVKRSVYEEIGGYNPEAGYASDWEMWQRIATCYSYWFEPQPLAVYSLHSLSASSTFIKSGNSIRDIRRTIKIAESYLPSTISRQTSSLALEHYALWALSNAYQLFIQGEIAGAVAQIREGLKCSQSPQVQNQLSKILAQPNTEILKQELLKEKIEFLNISTREKYVNELENHLKIDVVLQVNGNHGWSCSYGWINNLQKLGLLNRVFKPNSASWANNEPLNDDGLFEYLGNPDGDIMILCGFDWHSQPLHKTQKWLDRWHQAKITKIALLQECYSSPAMQNTPSWQQAMEEAILTTIPCVDALMCNHEPDVEFLKNKYNISLPIIYLPFYIDSEYFVNHKPFQKRKNQAIFRGNAPNYYQSQECYQQRRKLIQALQEYEGVDLFANSLYNSNQTPSQNVQTYVDELNNYRIGLNLPSMAPTFTVRPFEIMACGALLLQDRIIGEQSQELFKDWEHLVYYDPDQPDDLKAKIDYLIRNPELTQKIAQQGQSICHQFHTLENRIEFILNWVTSNFKTTFSTKKVFDKLNDRLFINKKILVINNIYPPQELGGYGRYISDFANILRERGHQVKVLTSDASYLQEIKENEPYIDRNLILFGDYKKLPPKVIEDQKQLKKIINNNSRYINEIIIEFQPDVALIGNIDFLSSNIFLPFFENKIPVINHLAFNQPGYSLDEKPNNPLYHLSTCSYHVKENTLNLGYEFDDISVIYPGAYVDDFAQEHLPKFDKLKIVFASIVSSYKGPQTLIESLAILHHEGFDFDCILAGSAPIPEFKKDLEKFIQDHGMEHKVKLIGYQSRETLIKLYRERNVFIFPSVWDEPFGISQVEGMAAGLTTITSATGGASEIVEHGISGLKFERNNPLSLAFCLLRLLANKENWANISKQGVMRAKKAFDIYHSVDLLEKKFAELLLKRDHYDQWLELQKNNNANNTSIPLTDTNYLIFPDWQTDEETLTEELYNLISTLAQHSPISDSPLIKENHPVSDSPLIKGGWGGSNPAPSGKKTNAENIITLIIDRTSITEEDANLIISGIAMNLMMEEDLDLENILNFSFIDNIEESQWQKILPKITAKITLNCDNQDMVNNPLFEDLITIMADRTNYAIFTDWSIDEEKLFTTFSNFLKHISTQEKATVLINLNHSNEEEVGLFVSEVIMNLMLEEGINLSENIHVNFVDFTATQWGSLEGLIKEKLTINN